MHKAFLKSLRNKNFYALIKFRQNLFNQVEVTKLSVVERITPAVAKFSVTDTFI